MKRPLLHYHGGKWKIAPWIISYMPPHLVYVELFGGGGSVLLRKPRAHFEVYNDLDKQIVNLFQIMRDRGEELIHKLILTPYARDEFDLSYQPTDDPLEAARRTVVLSFMGIGTSSVTRGRRSGFKAAMSVPASHNWKTYPNNLNAVIERLQGVVIENRNAFDLIPKYDSAETLFYADPPYLPSVRDYGTDYKYEMTEEDHIKLADALRRVKGAVIVSGYHSELYNELYRGWDVREKHVWTDMALPRTEVLLMKGIEHGLFGEEA